MLFDRFRKKFKSDPKINEWLSKQSFPDDALTYLIEKELYEHGTRDLGYIIPRKRNDDYFAQLLDRESYDVRYKSNLAMYESIADVHDVQEPTKLKPVQSRHHEPTKKTIEKIGTVPSTSYSKGLTSINKGRKIYNTTSSSVVVTVPEEQFHHEEADLSCFDD